MPSVARSPRSNSERSAASSRPTTQIPAPRSRVSVAGRPPTRAIGTYSAAPAAALATVGVTWTARCRGISTPSTPAPSQLRRIAPRLPGSVTPSTATRNGRRPRRPRSRSSRVGLGKLGGEGDHALRRLALGPCLELGLGDVGDRHPPDPGQLGDVGDAVVAGEIRRQPDLLHPPATGDEQFAHGLATFDLLSAEPLAVPLGRVVAELAGATGGLRSWRHRSACRVDAGRHHLRRRRPGGPLRHGTATAGGDDRLSAAATLVALARSAPAGWLAFLPPASRWPRPPRPPPERGAALTALLCVTTTAAKHTTPSPRPIAPSPSARRPFTDTGAPTASLRRCCISARRGASFGDSQTTEQSALPIVHPSPISHRRHTLATARSSRRLPAPGRCPGNS